MNSSASCSSGHLQKQYLGYDRHEQQGRGTHDAGRRAARIGNFATRVFEASYVAAVSLSSRGLGVVRCMISIALGTVFLC